MAEVERFTMRDEARTRCRHPNGKWVHYSDYEQAEKRGAEKERERIWGELLSLDSIDNAQIAAGVPNQRGSIDRPTAEQMRKGVEAARHVAFAEAAEQDRDPDA